jgi:EpsI family protein
MRTPEVGVKSKSGLPRSLVIYGSVAVLVAAGVFEGLRTNRWGQTEDMKAAVTRLAAVPATFGDWTSQEQPIDEKVLKVAEATGSVSRTYANRKTGNVVSVLILCGPPGPIGAHTPDICYKGIGFEMDGREEHRTVAFDDKQATYWAARFQRQTTGDNQMRVAWMWGVDGDWSASSAPRREFALRKALYKLYVSRAVTPADREANPPVDRTQEFLADFLPVVKKALAPG